MVARWRRESDGEAVSQQMRFPRPPVSDFGPLCVGIWRRTDGSIAAVEGWDSAIVRLRRGDDELRRVSRVAFLRTHELVERKGRG